MEVMVAIQHPAHVHFYRHAIAELRDRGHAVDVVVRAKDVATALLDAFGIAYERLAGTADSLPGLLASHCRYEARLLARARRREPDVLTAVGGLSVAHVGWLLGIPSVAFIDNEGVASTRATVPFADAVCTPGGLRSDYGLSHRRYDGYHELAYLHPDRFEPNPDRLREHGVDPEERYFVLRFVGWNAHHDVGQGGFSPAGLTRLVDTLAERGTVYITSESPLPERFEPYRLPVPPHLVHDLLAGAALYAGDSQTMATEAAVLGTPAVRSNSFVGPDDMSNFVDLETEYGLLYSRADERVALRLVERLADDPDAAARWRERRDRLLDDTIDVTGYVVDTLREFGSAGTAGSTDGERHQHGVEPGTGNPNGGSRGAPTRDVDGLRLAGGGS